MAAVELLCLANSRKMNGRCVAGLTADGRWIRPVHPDGDGTLFWKNYHLGGGSEPAILDVISVDVAGARPSAHQPENWVIGDRPWTRLRRATSGSTVEFLRSKASPGPGLLGSSGDRILRASDQDRALPASLTLVEPANLRWRIAIDPRGRRQTRARFRVGEGSYDLSVTDPAIENRLGSLPVGWHPVSTAGIGEHAALFLTISLGEPWNGACYKIIAGVVAIE